MEVAQRLDFLSLFDDLLGLMIDGSSVPIQTVDLYAHPIDRQECVRTMINKMKLTDIPRFGIESFEKAWKDCVTQMTLDDIHYMVLSEFCRAEHVSILLGNQNLSLLACVHVSEDYGHKSHFSKLFSFLSFDDLSSCHIPHNTSNTRSNTCANFNSLSAFSAAHHNSATHTSSQFLRSAPDFCENSNSNSNSSYKYNRKILEILVSCLMITPLTEEKALVILTSLQPYFGLNPGLECAVYKYMCTKWRIAILYALASLKKIYDRKYAQLGFDLCLARILGIGSHAQHFICDEERSIVILPCMELTVELLASHGATMDDENILKKFPALYESYDIGRKVYGLKSMTSAEFNSLLPLSFAVELPCELRKLLLSYL